MSHTLTFPFALIHGSKKRRWPVWCLISVALGCGGQEQLCHSEAEWDVWPEFATRGTGIQPLSGDEVLYANLIGPKGASPAPAPVRINVTKGEYEIIQPLVDRVARIIWVDRSQSFMVTYSLSGDITLWNLGGEGELAEVFTRTMNFRELSSAWIDERSEELIVWGKRVRAPESDSSAEGISALALDGTVRWAHTLPELVDLIDVRSDPESSRCLLLALDGRDTDPESWTLPGLMWMDVGTGTLGTVPVMETAVVRQGMLHPSRPLAFIDGGWGPWGEKRHGLGFVGGDHRFQGCTYVPKREVTSGIWVTEEQLYLLRFRSERKPIRQEWALWWAGEPPSPENLQWRSFEGHVRMLSGELVLSSKGILYRACLLPGPTLVLTPEGWTGSETAPPGATIRFNHPAATVELPQALRTYKPGVSSLSRLTCAN